VITFCGCYEKKKPNIFPWRLIPPGGGMGGGEKMSFRARGAPRSTRRREINESDDGPRVRVMGKTVNVDDGLAYLPNRYVNPLHAEPSDVAGRPVRAADRKKTLLIILSFFLRPFLASFEGKCVHVAAAIRDVYRTYECTRTLTDEIPREEKNNNNNTTRCVRETRRNASVRDTTRIFYREMTTRWYERIVIFFLFFLPVLVRPYDYAP
jgi:hypothetical protein